MSIPTLTKEWLENAMGEKIERFDVSPGCNPGDGYLAVLYSIQVTYEKSQDEKEQKPSSHLMLKTFPTNPGRQEMLTNNNLFHRELSVYNTVLPEMLRFQKENCKGSEIIHLPMAKFIYGNSVDYRQKTDENRGELVDPLENCIIMNDLRKDGGFRIADRLVGLDLDHCSLVIEAQAKLHAVSWAYKQVTKTDRILSKFPFLGNTPFDDMGEPMILGIFGAQIGTFTRAIEGHLTSEEETKAKSDLLESLDRFQKLVMDVLALYFSDTRSVSDLSITKDNILRVPQPAQDDEEPWLVLTHGDSWLNNQMFRYDDQGKPVEVKLVDLQMSREGDLMCDLAYSIYANTTTAFRKAHLDEILQIYYQTFTKTCEQLGVDPLVGFTLSELNRRFHRSKIFGFLMSVVVLPLILNEVSKDLEEITEMKSESDFINELMGSPIDEQPKFRQRAVDFVKELREEGVI